MTKDNTGAERQKRHRARVMERLKQAVSGNDLHRELSAAYFGAASARADAFLAGLHAKPMDFPPPVLAKILAHMEEWREAFTHDGLVPAGIITQAVRKAAATLAWECMDEDLREQVAIALPADSEAA